MLHVHGAAAIAYRLYDVGYAIDLTRALDLLAASGPERVRPVRGEAQALQISNPPITVVLGTEIVVLGEVSHVAEVSARIFDFGVVSLRVRFAATSALTWEAFTVFGRQLEHHPGVLAVIEHHLRLLTERMAPAVDRPAVADVHEDYTVFRVSHLTEGPDLPAGEAGADAGADAGPDAGPDAGVAICPDGLRDCGEGRAPRCRRCCRNADCDDQNGCTTDRCDPEGRCAHTSCEGARVCCAGACAMRCP